MTASHIIDRARVTGILAALGAAAGALTAVVLTSVGTWVAQAFERHGTVVYFWSAAELAILGAIGTPILAWSLMRRAPLWRAVLEPAIGGVLGTLAGLATLPLFGLIFLPPLLVLAGVVGAALRLDRASQTALRVRSPHSAAVHAGDRP